MVTFSLILLVLLTLVVPLIAALVYCYVKEKGWVALVLGMTYMGLTIVLVRMIIPAVLYSFPWFIDLVNNRTLFGLVYSLAFALLWTGFTWLAFRFGIKSPDDSRAVVYGFGAGFFYEALFIGFNGMSAIFSSNAAVIDESQLGGLYLAMLEALMMLVLYSGFAWIFYRGRKQKKPLWMLACLAMVFGLLYIGSSWQEVWHLPRLALEFLILAASIGMGYVLYRSISWKNFIKTEEPKEEEDLEFLESLERLEKETANTSKKSK